MRSRAGLRHLPDDPRTFSCPYAETWRALHLVPCSTSVRRGKKRLELGLHHESGPIGAPVRWAPDASPMWVIGPHRAPSNSRSDGLLCLMRADAARCTILAEADVRDAATRPAACSRTTAWASEARVHTGARSDWHTRASASLSARRGWLRFIPGARHPSPPTRQEHARAVAAARDRSPDTACGGTGPHVDANHTSRAVCWGLGPAQSLAAAASLAGAPINPLGWGGARVGAEPPRGAIGHGDWRARLAPIRANTWRPSGGPLLRCRATCAMEIECKVKSRLVTSTVVHPVQSRCEQEETEGPRLGLPNWFARPNQFIRCVRYPITSF